MIHPLCKEKKSKKQKEEKKKGKREGNEKDCFQYPLLFSISSCCLFQSSASSVLVLWLLRFFMFPPTYVTLLFFCLARVGGVHGVEAISYCVRINFVSGLFNLRTYVWVSCFALVSTMPSYSRLKGGIGSRPVRLLLAWAL